MLTGESDLVEKDATLLYPQEQPIADQHNMAFMSTVVAAGHGHGIVVRCAKDSEVGKIAALLKEESEEKTPLQQRLASLSRLLGIGSVVICLLLFLIALAQGRDLLDMQMCIRDRGSFAQLVNGDGGFAQLWNAQQALENYGKEREHEEKQG